MWWPFLLLLLLLPAMVYDYHDSLQDILENKLLFMHHCYVQLVNSTDWWICTHSPLSSKTLPYVTIPAPPEELLNTTQNNYRDLTMAKVQLNSDGTAISGMAIRSKVDCS